MVQSYKKQINLKNTYDVILIGSGMGSLTAGALLAKEGKKVLILEKHYTAGGFTHVFKRKGYEWDVGIHYIGEVQRPNSPVKKLFDYVSNSQLKWADMGDVYDRIIIGDKTYDFVKGIENFKNQLIGYFPDEEGAIKAYITHVIAANKANGKFYASKAIPVLLNKIIGWKMRKKHLNYSDKTTYDVISALTKNEALIKVLTGQYGDYGLPPKQSSFAMHAAVVKHYFHGGSFPIGGSSQIVKTINPIISEAGGAIVISADVKEIIIENNKAKGVLMADGKSFFSNIIISGTGVINTFKKLIPQAVSKKHGLLDKLQKVNPSVSHASLYIGLNGSPEALKLPKTNLWIYPKEGDHDTLVSNYVKDIDAPFPVVYVSFPSAKDPDWSNRYPGKSTINIITLLPFDVFSNWEDSKWMKRGDDYNELKNILKNKKFTRLKSLAHKIKPNFSLIDLDNLKLICSNIENSKDWEIAQKSTQNLINIIPNIITKIETELNKYE